MFENKYMVFYLELLLYPSLIFVIKQEHCSFHPTKYHSMKWCAIPVLKIKQNVKLEIRIRRNDTYLYSFCHLNTKWTALCPDL